MDDDAEIAIIEGLDNVLIDFDVFCSGFELICSIGDRNMLPKQEAGSFLDFDVGRICGQLVVEPDVVGAGVFDCGFWGFARDATIAGHHADAAKSQEGDGGENA